MQVRAEGGAGRDRRPAGDARNLPSRRARVAEPARMSVPCVTLAVPCRTDEPVLGRTLDAAWASWQAAAQAETHILEVIVCLNGPAADCEALRDLRAFAAAHGTPLAEVDADAAPAPPATPPAVTALRTQIGRAHV